MLREGYWLYGTRIQVPRIPCHVVDGSGIREDFDSAHWVTRDNVHGNFEVGSRDLKEDHVARIARICKRFLCLYDCL